MSAAPPAVAPATPITTTGFAAFEANIEAWIQTKIAEIEPIAVDFLDEVEQDAEIAFEDLAEIAGQAVLTQATSLASGTEKFGTAVTSVVQTVEAAGKTVLESTAQTAVQQAYAKIGAVAQTLLPPPAPAAA